MSKIAPIGLLAGNRDLPLLVARKVLKLGKPLVVAGILGEADPALQELAHEFKWLKLGQLQALMDFFREAGVREMVMIGGISRETLLLNYEPDETAVAVIETLEDLHTDKLLRAVATCLQDNGLSLRALADILPELLTCPGCLTRQQLSPELTADLKVAWRMAKELGRLDVGQTVVVSDLVTLAVEAAEGTDATVIRGASLAKKPVAVAKVVKPGQDLRLDPPVIGPDTIKIMVEAGVGALAVDASQIIIVSREETIHLADQAGLAVVAWTDLMAGYE